MNCCVKVSCVPLQKEMISAITQNAQKQKKGGINTTYDPIPQFHFKWFTSKFVIHDSFPLLFYLAKEWEKED